jgi:hypothetical protein
MRWMVGLMALASLASCNRYELFLTSGFEQESFSNKADVIFVVDNSDSMYEVSASLAANFASFIQSIETQEEQLPTDGLSDAADNYVDYVQNRSSFVDFQFAITTTDVESEVGEALGGVYRRGDPNLARDFVETLLCEATCFREDLQLPTDPTYECGQPLGEEVTEEYLDCVCGAGTWQGNCGAAVEEGLESAYMAMCAAVSNPPVACFEDVLQVADATNEEDELVPALFGEADVLKNEGVLRPRANTIVVIVSDEGDGSRRLDREPTAEVYEALFEQFGRRVTFAAIVPGLDTDGTVACPGTATDWGVSRYNYMAYRTGGLVEDILEPPPNCEPRDFGVALDALGELLTNLLTTFPLRSVPHPDTLVVKVDGKDVPQAEIVGTDTYGFDVYGDGWSYSTTDNAVEFHGTAIPGYDAEVQVLYLPIEGMPRDLPF